MGRYIQRYVMFLVVALVSAVPAFAENVNKGNFRKLYFPKENVALHDNKILVGSGTRWIPIAQLSADQSGFYVMEKDSSLFQWECPRCGHDNWFWEDYCWFCGYEN